MINLKNILKVLLIALFVCVWSGDIWAEEVLITKENAAQYGYDSQNMPPAGTKYDTDKKASVLPNKDTTVTGQGGLNDASFCNGDLGIFSELVQTGQMIFNRLRDLIYVVAGFGIIAVAVGGFFGNLNWKWLGAIVISLVVIATAGELIVLMTGCESFNGSLITNTLTNPTPTMTTDEYNEQYTVETTSSGKIRWDDMLDQQDYYAGSIHDTAASTGGDTNTEVGHETDSVNPN